MNVTISHGKELEYSDVLLVPQESDLSSRSDADTRITIGDFDFHLPVVPANMETVIDLEVAKALDDAGYFYVMHRFDNIFKTLQYMHHNKFRCKSISVGVNQDTYDVLDKILDTGYFIDIITIDVAHGHHIKAKNMVRYIKSRFPEATIIAGNVVTGEMTEELILNGADIVKVGIGPGSVCTTRIQTGVGYPQLSAVIECADAAHGVGGHIMADGGCTCPGDVAKAFGAGADFVMLGGMLAGHDECSGEVVDGYKEFYGMSSSSAMKKYSGGVANYRSSEGKTVKVPYRGPVSETVKSILGGVRSACTYTGARTIKQMPKCATFVRVNQQSNEIFGKNS